MGQISRSQRISYSRRTYAPTRAPIRDCDGDCGSAGVALPHWHGSNCDRNAPLVRPSIVMWRRGNGGAWSHRPMQAAGPLPVTGIASWLAVQKAAYPLVCVSGIGRADEKVDARFRVLRQRGKLPAGVIEGEGHVDRRATGRTRLLRLGDRRHAGRHRDGFLGGALLRLLGLSGADARSAWLVGRGADGGLFAGFAGFRIRGAIRRPVDRPAWAALVDDRGFAAGGRAGAGVVAGRHAARRGI